MPVGAAPLGRRSRKYVSVTSAASNDVPHGTPVSVPVVGCAIVMPGLDGVTVSPPDVVYPLTIWSGRRQISVDAGPAMLGDPAFDNSTTGSAAWQNGALSTSLYA